MSASELREAARVLRERMEPEDSPLGLALADWLDTLAADVEDLETILPPHPGTPAHPAMRVADAGAGGAVSECTHPCDHCRPEFWHGCVRPAGHAGYHGCEPDPSDYDESEEL